MLDVLKSIFSIFLCFILTGLNPQSFKAVLEERKELASPVIDEAVKGMIKGSFIQSWLAVAMKEEDWDTEFAKMRELGMEYLIFQTLFVGGKPLYSTDPAVENDMLSTALKAAKKHGIKIIIGLTEGSAQYYSLTDAIADLAPWTVPFEEFHKQDLEEATRMIDEILEKYGEAYGGELYGWYFTHEFYNSPFYSPAAWKSLGRQLNGYVRAIENSSAPDMPLLLSPYYIIGSPSIRPDGFAAGLRILFGEAQLRPIDVFMPQDGYGTVSQSLPVDIVVPSLLSPWIGAMSKVAEEFGFKFWINNEAFMTSNIETRPPEQLAAQVLATDKYAETHFIFSWNHYYSATFYKGKADLEQRFFDIFAP